MKILIADDDATNRSVLKALLKKLQYEVITASNGEEAVELFADHAPDMVLLDVLMPVMDGYAAAAAIKTLSANRFVPIVFVTAMADDESLARCIEAGGDDFLTKPFSAVILQAKIKAHARFTQLHETVTKQKHLLELSHEQINQEYQVAERIHRGIVNRNVSDLHCVSSFCKPSTLFSGDILLTARCPDGGLNILVGDFTGHGLSAAIGALPTSDVFYTMSAKGFATQDIVYEINRKLCSFLPVNMFLAMGIAHLDVQNKKLSVINAGIPDMLFFSTGLGPQMKRFVSTMLPLGIVECAREKIIPEVVEMLVGDRLVLYTDGATDLENNAEVAFGQEHLETVVQGFDANCGVECIKTALETYANLENYHDDITIARFQFDVELLQQVVIAAPKPLLTQSARDWHFELELRDGMLRDFDPLPIIIQMLLDIQGLREHRTNLFTVLSELYNNALDHGVLKLDSCLKKSHDGFSEYYEKRKQRLEDLSGTYIRIFIRCEKQAESMGADNSSGGRLWIELEDSGKGFDLSTLEKAPVVQEGLSGRGMVLVRQLCQNLDYYDTGNRVRACYVWR